MAAPTRTVAVQVTAVAGAGPVSTPTTLSSGTRKWAARYSVRTGSATRPALDVTAIDVGALDQIIPSLIAQGIAKQEGDAVVINVADMGIEKVLGSGKVTKKINLSASSFSEIAKAKIEKMGGKALVV